MICFDVGPVYDEVERVGSRCTRRIGCRESDTGFSVGLKACDCCHVGDFVDGDRNEVGIDDRIGPIEAGVRVVGIGDIIVQVQSQDVYPLDRGLGQRVVEEWRIVDGCDVKINEQGVGQQAVGSDDLECRVRVPIGGYTADFRTRGREPRGVVDEPDGEEGTIDIAGRCRIRKESFLCSCGCVGGRHVGWIVHGFDLQCE